MKVSVVLTKALEILGPNGENWIKGDLCRSDTGVYISEPTSPAATCFCALGAVARAAGLSRYQAYEPHRERNPGAAALVLAIRPCMNDVEGAGDEAYQFNDAPGRTFAEVKDLFERAIAAAKADEAAHETA